ncbi:ribonuclease R [Chitinophaga eiseniae]|uniref:Ribonuclease R n=1 Tax=Chitinophaga eiseniae TaxID=634771 RepID=A0A1T4U097_9BACT|nr:ribonuclease R [Chitinophaga eiseniae]SKA45909.1 ribonuclease R [Chitinophaga eiseniae]
MSKKKKDKKHPGQKKTFRGVVELTRSGMAFVIVPGLARDIMVKQKNLHTALDKDEVLVDVIKHARGDGRQEGIITDILKRNKTEFTGTLQVSKSFGFLITEKGMFMPDIYIPANSLNGGKSGDKAVVKVVAWGEKTRKPVGEVIEILDASDTNDLAMKEILIEAGFPLSFPAEVMTELAAMKEEITETEVRKRKDCRNILTFTIDPVDAKDFDDAISIRPLKNGLYEIGVHIADVSHYVVPGTELDKEADRRATSVYLPDRVLPMLPEKISNELCSLRPHEDKLTFSAIFQMNEKGEVKHHWIGRTIIHSNHRFTYEDAQEVIETKEGPYQQEILLLNKIAQTLRQERFAHGAINFSSQEVRFRLDEKGKPIGIVIKESKEAHQLIEEFMLLANRTVATYVSKIKVNKQSVPFPYRVHDTPDPDKLKVFAAFAGKFGYKFDVSNPESIARSFNRMLQLVQGKPEQHVLETLGIRTMAKAIYTIENVGHYGLGFEDYCHFTSPIRRYPDVLVHRVVAECLAGDIHPDKQMEKKCKHDSEMERKAMEAERAANKYKQVEYMQQYIGHTFDGVISGVAHFGFWVETVDTKCEGLVSIHNLNRKEEFVFNEAEYALVGQASGRRFRIGEKVSIRVVAANLAKRQLDYELDSELATEAGREFRPERRDERREGHRDRKKKKQKHGQQPWQPREKQPFKPQPAAAAPVVSLEIPPEPVVDQVIPETHVVDVTPPPSTSVTSASPATTEAPVKKKKTAKKETAEKAAPAAATPVPAPVAAAPETAPASPEKIKTNKGKKAPVQPAAQTAPAAEKAGKKTTPATSVAVKPAAKAATKKPAAKAAPAEKKKAVKTVAPKAAAKKAVKTATAKATAKKAAVSKAPAAKKAVAPKAAAKKAAVPAKKAAAKKAAVAPAKKAAVKAPAKKAAVKAPAKKAAVAKAPAKKAATSAKAPAKKATPKKAAAAKKKTKK